MAEMKEQDVCFKFCFKLEKNATEAFEVCFGEQKIGRTQVF
jgi:hypothetical protein